MCVLGKGTLYMFGNGRHGKLALGDENFANQFKPCPVHRFKHFYVESVRRPIATVHVVTVKCHVTEFKHWRWTIVLHLSYTPTYIMLYCSGFVRRLPHISVRAKIARKWRRCDLVGIRRGSSRQCDRRASQVNK